VFLSHIPVHIPVYIYILKQEFIQNAAKNVKFMVGPEEIVRNKTFKYLGCIINDSDNYLPAVENQLKQARQVWARISRIIKKD
jgi:hypothetical protein